MSFLRQDSVRPAGERTNVWLLRGLVAAGMIALLYYCSWWGGAAGRLSSPWLALALVAAVSYSGAQLAGSWLVYLAARHRPAPPPPPRGLTVDVFVTACKEPYALIERALAAACALGGEHRTWLLDDGADPALARLAERLGAGYLTRTERTDAKAGNVNAALPRTTGDVIAIFDIDHVPTPDFLERTVGYFADPAVGFVQVMITFSNTKESWVAQAAAETSLDFYNPTSIGMDAIGGVTMMGSNALIRRKALAAIGGYQPGLAEDLATSITLHAAGWRSVYVAEPLAPGLAPATIVAWFTQQLKWARGVFELLLTLYPRLFARLTWGQRLCYAIRMTKYWIGPVVCIHLFVTLALLIGGGGIARAGFQQYLIHLTPLALLDVLIRKAAMSAWGHPSASTTSPWRAVALVYFSWPVYTLAWMMAVLRLPLAFRPTPKSADGGLNPIWISTQVATVLLLAGGVYSWLARGKGYQLPVLLGFATVQSALQLLVLCQRLRPQRLKGLLADARSTKPLALPLHEQRQGDLD